MKLKRSITTPAILLVYLVGMAIYAFPQYQESQNWLEYLGIIGATVGIIVLLYFTLRRREKFRERNSNAKNDLSTKDKS